MTIIYTDDLGPVSVTLTDGESIDFCNGKCFFTAGEKDYAVPVENILRIVR